MMLAAVLGSAVGVLLGLLGGGGSLLAVPLLAYGLGMDAAASVPTALLGVGLAALAAAAVHARRGGVDVRIALPFLLIGALASALGAWAGRGLGDPARPLLFAAVAAAAGLRMLRRPPRDPGPPRPAPLGVAAAAAGAGFLTGVLGVGGGFLIVPALTLAGGLPIERAVGTASLVLGVTALAGFAAHRATGGPLPDLAPLFAVSASLAAAGAALVSARLPAAPLKRSFAALLLAVSIASVGQAVAR